MQEQIDTYNGALFNPGLFGRKNRIANRVSIHWEIGQCGKQIAFFGAKFFICRYAFYPVEGLGA